MHLRPLMREDLLSSIRAKYGVEHVSQALCHFARRGMPSVSLAMDVAMMPASQGGHGVALRKARHSPASDRRSDEVHRPLPHGLKELSEKKTVESGNREPLCAARRTREYVDVFSPQTAVANDRECARSGAHGQRRFHGRRFMASVGK